MNQSGRARRFVADVGDILETMLDELTVDMTTLLLDRIPALPGDAAMIDLLRASVNSNLVAAIALFRDRVDLADLVGPEGAREYARGLAQRGASGTALVRAYRLGQQLTLQRSLEVLGRLPANRQDLLAALEVLVALNFGYIDSITEQVMTEYQAERERWLSHRRTARAEVLERLLGQRAPDLETAEAALGYGLRGHHQGLVLWTGDARASVSRLDRLENLVADLADAVKAIGKPLIWPRDTSTVWAWLPLRSESQHVDLDRLDALLATADADIHLALGVAGTGLQGFRQSHHDAIRAARVATIAGAQVRRVTSYADPGVRAAALLSADLDAARRLVAAALGGLAVDEPGAAMLRDTMRVFFDEKGSYVAAAGRLHVHKNTVKYRIAKAVELRGRSIESDRLDTELALVAAHWLGAAVLLDAP